MRFEVGQILVFEVDAWSRDSSATALLLGNPWTHVSLVVRGGDERTAEVLNTYPATNAEIIPLQSMLRRRWELLDPRLTPQEKVRLRKAAVSLVGRGYWLSPCSRVVAEVFYRAGIPLLDGGAKSWRERALWLLPHEYLTRVPFSVVARKTTTTKE